MQQLKLESISKQFGELEIIKKVNLEVNKGEFIVIVGPSGCGKSTLLRMIAGLETVTNGMIRIAGEDVTRATPTQRQIAMVFQSYALYPHMTVEKNIAFGLKMSKMPKQQISSRIKEAARMLQLESLLKRKPKELSGGQRQRVAIGRAIVREPEVFLFDEPLSNLDAELRVEMRVQLTKLHRKLKATMIYVTHDQVEAMTMADRIVVIKDGNLEQIGKPLELYNEPQNKFVAGFLGSPKMNFIPVIIMNSNNKHTTVLLPCGSEIRIPRIGNAVTGNRITLGIRPSDIDISNPQAEIKAKTDVCENLGNKTLAYCEYQDISLVLEVDQAFRVNTGDLLPLSFPPGKCHLFNEKGIAFRPTLPRYPSRSLSHL